MEQYQKQLLDLWARWQAMSLKRKLAWGGGTTFTLALAGLLWWASQPEYRVLYSGLSAEESGAITSKLQTKGVPYKLAAGGTTILVPSDQAMQVHLDMTNENVAGSSKIGKGFDLFDQPMIGATPFNQHVNFLRAQQSELARTIMQIDPIVFARVHIVRPEPSPFVREQKATTASVMVKLRQGATLNRNTVDGIAALVSGSIEGLTKDNVKIIDANGKLVTNHVDPESGMLGSFVEQRKEVEHYLASEAERILTQVLGDGRAIVRVTADLNTKQMREKKEIILADGRVQRTEKTTLSKTNTTTPSKGGAAGSTSNLGKSGNTGSVGGTNTVQETQQSDYDYPRTTQEWQNKFGSIDRLTIAAFVDLAGPNGAEPAMSLDDVRETIKKAVGFKADRDDIQVTQVRIPVPTPEAFDADFASQQQMQSILTMVRYGSIGMVGLFGAPLLWFLLRRRVAQPTAAVQGEPAKLQLVTEELERNPEALAHILTMWIDKADASEKKAA